MFLGLARNPKAFILAIECSLQKQTLLLDARVHSGAFKIPQMPIIFL